MLISYINDAAYSERPYEPSIKESNCNLEDFDLNTFTYDEVDRQSSSPYSGSTSKTQMCKVVEDPELVRKRVEKYNAWLKNKR